VGGPWLGNRYCRALGRVAGAKAQDSLQACCARENRNEEAWFIAGKKKIDRK